MVKTLNSADASPAGQDEATVKRLRLGVGTIAALLPPVVLFGNMLFAGEWVFLGSISGSYYTDMRGVFVGSMCAIGVFLICYRYDRLDDIWSTIAGALAIVVALFPTTPEADPARHVVVTRTETVIGAVHFTCAAALFLVLAYFCLGLFPRSPGSATFFLHLFAQSSGTESRRKNRRDRIYRACGWIILASVVAAAVIAVALPKSVRDSWNTLFWCETVAVMSFAVAWLTKGGFFFWCNDLAEDTTPG